MMYTEPSFSCAQGEYRRLKTIEFTQISIWSNYILVDFFSLHNLWNIITCLISNDDGGWKDGGEKREPVASLIQ